MFLENAFGVNFITMDFDHSLVDSVNAIMQLIHADK